MFRGREESWNLRDRHMAETLEALLDHLSVPGAPARAVVWAHNSHVGDARATEMGRRRGELNVGQLAREAYGRDAVLVGFTTATGTVTAARDWGAPAERRRVREPLDGSWEALLHAAAIERFLLLPAEAAESSSGTGRAADDLLDERLERAIGVIYRPQTERLSHYFDAELLRQFDAVLHMDKTSAVEPLESDPGWERAEPPETYPSAL
jgi:erythromycin esterase-like protein